MVVPIPPMVTRRSTCSGAASANSVATNTPIEFPMIRTVSSPRPSRNAVTACCADIIGCAAPKSSLTPNPGNPSTSVRKRCAKVGTLPAADDFVPPFPDR